MAFQQNILACTMRVIKTGTDFTLRYVIANIHNATLEIPSHAALEGMLSPSSLRIFGPMHTYVCTGTLVEKHAPRTHLITPGSYYEVFISLRDSCNFPAYYYEILSRGPATYNVTMALMLDVATKPAVPLRPTSITTDVTCSTLFHIDTTIELYEPAGVSFYADV